MHAARFQLHQAHDLAGAVSALSDSADSAVLAGGQSLVPELRARCRRPELLVDINGVPELAGTSVRTPPGTGTGTHTEGTPVILAGATARQADVLAAAARLPAQQFLASVLRTIGTASVRARGTVAGLIAQANQQSQLAAFCVLYRE